LLVDPPKPGAWNMAADEALLDAADRSNVAAIRFYRWREPTLSLGYFQPIAQRADHPPSREVAVVRRLSGGGALVHDQELTYSLALPASQPLTQNHKSLYALVHQAFINTLHDLGIHARMQRDDSVNSTSPPEHPAEAPFLCFQRHDPGDVLMSGSGGQPVKILGSAQRRRRGALLQHGSLLLATSRSAPELSGLDELVHHEPDHSNRLGYAKLMELWCLYIKVNLGLDLLPSHWSPRQLDCIQQYQQAKYCCPSWTEAR
jgi:lipoate-protein ligase A